MPEPLLLLVALSVAGAAVLAPLWSRRGAAAAAAAEDELEAARLRHRVALEALRDVEADHRAGLLDDVMATRLRAEAEAHAAATHAAATPALDDRGAGLAAPGPMRGRGRTLAIVAAGVIGLALVVGSMIPATGIANETVVDERLAAARDAEAQRQARIAELRDDLAADPTDPDTISALADAHLAGGSLEDLRRAVAALQLLVSVEPDRADAYERMMAAYLRAGDHANARAVWSSYSERSTADPAELAFFDGLIALRGEGDPDAAVEAFDRFLELAPDDPRAPMVRGLRDEAAGAD